MIARKSLQRYIEKCTAVLIEGNDEAAESLEDEIIAVFGNDLKGLNHGLSNYSVAAMVSFGDGTFYGKDEPDFLRDIEILRSRLMIELEKIEDNIEKTNIINKKEPIVFISHATDDVRAAEALIELLDRIGIKEESILSSSVTGHTAPPGCNKYDYIARELRENELDVLFMLSENYYNEPASLNEMGAVWVLGSNFTAFFLPGFTYKKMDGAIDPRSVAIKLDAPLDAVNSQLGQLRDHLQGKFGLDRISNEKWERVRKNFTDAVCGKNVTSDQIIENNSIETIVRKIKDYKTAITKEVIVDLGFTQEEANIILARLEDNGYLEKSRYGLYKWKDQKGTKK